MPDLTFFLDLKPEEGLRRIAEHRSDEVNRLDLEKLSFHEKVYEAYQILLKKYPERIVRIDASQSVEEEVKQIKKIILEKFAAKQK
jgi:dTMP kinase